MKTGYNQKCGMGDKEEKEFYTPKDLAKMFGVHPKTIIRMIKRGDIKGGKKGGRWYIHRDEVERIRRELIPRKP